MMVPLTMRDIFPTFLPVRFRMDKLTVGSPTGDIVPKRKSNPCPHNQPPKESIHNRIIGQSNHWHKLDKEGTHRHRDKGENSKLMANLIPSDDHQREVDGIKG